MDLNKALRLLNKIQAFLDNGNANELSRLEKDLIKTYVQQLYEAVTTEEKSQTVEPSKPAERHEPKLHKEEPVSKMEVPVIKIQEPPKQDYEKHVFPEYQHIEKEKPVEKEMPPLEIKMSPPAQESRAYQFHVPEPVKETVHAARSITPSDNSSEALDNLFDIHKSEDIASRFNQVTIPSIESAMGLNERIFTLNELFGGDKSLFDSWCSRLNNLNSFEEAKNVLISGPAKDFKWADPQRIKMAEQFIRIVWRKYPKSLS